MQGDLWKRTQGRLIEHCLAITDVANSVEGIGHCWPESKRGPGERDYKKYSYFIDGEGNICQKPKSGNGGCEVLVKKSRAAGQVSFLIDKDGDVARSQRFSGRKNAA
jgi:hypothetical protein